MSGPGHPPLPKLPFYIADAVVVLVAGGVLWKILPANSTGAFAVAAVCVAAVAFAAWISISPWLREFEAATKLTELDSVKSSVEQIGEIQGVARQIQDATSRWQTVSDAASKTALASNEILDRIKTESTEFVKSLQALKDEERRTMSLELEKLRRTEGDYLQVLVRVFDHVFALNQAARRSNQPALIQQLAQFQMACRDSARRVGLIAFAPEDGDPFDANSQQLENDSGQPPEGALIEFTVASGYVFQGQLLRKSLVRVQLPSAPEPTAPVAEITQPANDEAVPAPISSAPIAEEPPVQDDAATDDAQPPWETDELSESAAQKKTLEIPSNPVVEEQEPEVAKTKRSQKARNQQVETESGPTQGLLF